MDNYRFEFRFLFGYNKTVAQIDFYSNMKTLTKKQKHVFDFINIYIAENGISPTIEEVRKKLKLKAVSTVHEHINSLKEKGYLSKSENSARSLLLRKEMQYYLASCIFQIFYITYCKP